MKEQLQILINDSLKALLGEKVITEIPKSIRIDHSKEKDQGDFATNIALVLSKQAKCSPKILAEKILANFRSRGLKASLKPSDTSLVCDVNKVV